MTLVQSTHSGDEDDWSWQLANERLQLNRVTDGAHTERTVDGLKWDARPARLFCSEDDGRDARPTLARSMLNLHTSALICNRPRSGIGTHFGRLLSS